MPQHYTNSTPLPDNAEVAILVNQGISAVDVLVSFGAGADGTLTISREHQDASGLEPIVSLVESGIAGDQFTEVPGAAPNRFLVQRVASSAGIVTVALIPRTK